MAAKFDALHLDDPEVSTPLVEIIPSEVLTESEEKIVVTV